LKKAETLEAVVAALPSGSSPEDWSKINRRYQAHERQNTKGKGHPMSAPKQYLLNKVKNFIKTNP
jgi:hypothetical protein